MSVKTDVARRVGFLPKEPKLPFLFIGPQFYQYGHNGPPRLGRKIITLFCGHATVLPVEAHVLALSVGGWLRVPFYLVELRAHPLLHPWPSPGSVVALDADHPNNLEYFAVRNQQVRCKWSRFTWNGRLCWLRGSTSEAAPRWAAAGTKLTRSWAPSLLPHGGRALQVPLFCAVRKYIGRSTRGAAAEQQA